MKVELSLSSVSGRYNTAPRAGCSRSHRPIGVDVAGAATSVSGAFTYSAIINSADHGDDRRVPSCALAIADRRRASTRAAMATTANRAGARIAWKPNTDVGDPRVDSA